MILPMTLRTARLPSVIRRHPGVVPALVMLLLGACSTERSLMPTPLLYQDMSPRIFSEAISPERKRAELSLLYITDRAVSYTHL